MNKETIASLLGAIITLATLAGPALAGLNELPAPFCENGECNFLVVVGADAATADVVGAINVAARLAAEKYTLVSREAVTTVTGGTEEDVNLGQRLNNTVGTALEDDDLAGLQDTQITISIGDVEDDYDIHEEIIFGGDIAVETGLTGVVASVDEDYKDDIFLPAKVDSMCYKYVFDDTLKNGNYIANATEEEPIVLNFLGSELKIVGASSSSITVRTGESVGLQPGDSTTYEGKTITLVTVGDDFAYFECEGSSKKIDEGDTKTLCGVQIYVDSVINDEGTENDWVIIIVGKDVDKTYNNGDAYIGEDEDDPNWVWWLANLDTGSPTLGVCWDQNIDDPEDNPPEIGDCYEFPNGFARVCLDSVSVSDYQEYELSASTEELYDSTGSNQISSSAHVVVLKSLGGTDDGFTIGAYETDEIAIEVNGTGIPGALPGINVYWQDPDAGNKFKLVYSDRTDLTNNQIKINYQDATPELEIKVTNSTGGTTIYMNVTLKGALGNDVIFYFEGTTSNGFTYVGHSDGDTNTQNDILYGTRDISGWEENTRTPDGVVILDPDANAASDKYKFKVPSDYGSDFEVKVIVYGPETTTTTEEGGEIKEVSPMTMPIANLDTEIDDLSTVGKHVILVGGPAVNRWTAAVMGYSYPTYGPDITEFGEGEGFLGLYTGVEGVLADDQTALVIAGWEADQTRVACAAVQQFATVLTDITADKAIVTGSVESPTVTAVTEETTTTTAAE